MNWQRVGEVAKWTVAACILGLAVVGALAYVRNH